MNYAKIYNNLIEKSKARTLNVYYEVHHILPRCLGGTDDPQNLVKLTPEEHYVAHQLLVKIYPKNEKLVNAAIMMIPRRKSNKLYGWLKRRFSDVQSQRQRGEKNSQFGTRWVHNKKTKECKKIKGDLPSGWDEGRKILWDLNYSCAYCKVTFERESLEKFCSSKCKTYFRSPAIKIIDDNIEDIINTFHETKSIQKTLQRYGIKGVREGNKYLSKILKDKGIEVLKRRNSYAPKA